MNNRLYISLAGAVALIFAMCGCIKNDLPYGKVPLSITAFSVSGQTGDAVISEKDMTVTVNLEETANPAKSELLNIEYKATLRDGSDNNYHNNIESSVKKGDVLDLTDDLNIRLSLFQNYDWKIVSNQNIERIFKIDNQMGKPIFDYNTKTAIAYLRKGLPLSEVGKAELKLGPVGSNYEGVPTDKDDWVHYSNYNEALVKVTFSDFIDEEWKVRVYNFDKNLTKPANPGVNVAWVFGIGIEGALCSFEYKKVGDEEWILLPQKNIEMDGAEFSGIITGLEEDTEYVCRAVVDGMIDNEVNFKTYTSVDIPNMGFEDWHQNEKVICPWAQDGDSYWDTGNWGSATLSEKDNITTSTEDAQSGKAARLESRIIANVFAAGNLFIGKYKATVGMNGNLGFGREFHSFPTKLTGFYKYQTAEISNTTSGYENMKGQPDTGVVWIALVSGTPDENGTFVNILTNKDDSSKGEYFDKDADYVLAYGEMNINETVPDYKKFEIELEYRRTDVIPSGIIIVCSASKLGDYFTGGVGSTLWVDDFALEYDY